MPVWRRLASPISAGMAGSRMMGWVCSSWSACLFQLSWVCWPRRCSSPCGQLVLTFLCSELSPPMSELSPPMPELSPPMYL
ncbi:hypothetical protein ACOMHN_033847 [Nucella lapillus]